jgi:phosphate transport system substrate-binding protein
MNYKNWVIIEAIAVIALFGFSAYAVVTYPQSAQPITINGAGATFPAPLYQEWGSAYKSLTGVQVNYQPFGSGAGVNQFNATTVDFAASDPPLSGGQYSYFTTHGYKPLQIPMTIGGIVFAYNIPGVTVHLNFTATVLAAIFQGNITYWDNTNITSLNPAVTFTHYAIIICHRSDSSGSTKITSTYLYDNGAGQYGTWKIGVGNIVNWPTSSLGGSGNPGVAALIGNNQYSIGYVELQYALGSTLTYGKVQNPAGFFITPSLTSLSATVKAVNAVLPANGSSSLASVGVYLNLHSNSSNADACYPITSFTYIIVAQNLHLIPGMTPQKAQALRAFLLWAVNEGQTYSPGLSYVPLPANVVAFDELTIGSIYFA